MCCRGGGRSSSGGAKSSAKLQGLPREKLAGGCNGCHASSPEPHLRTTKAEKLGSRRCSNPGWHGRRRRRESLEPEAQSGTGSGGAAAQGGTRAVGAGRHESRRRRGTPRRREAGLVSPAVRRVARSEQAAQGGTGAVDIGRHESRRRRASPGQREAGSSRRRDARSRDLDVGKTAVSVRRGSLLDRDWQVRASSDATRCGAEGGPTASLLPSGAASLLPSGAELTLRMRPRGRGCAADGITGGGGGGSRPGVEAGPAGNGD
ncbi:hypothetical protein PVAP13_7NG183017 [Panicum virgatum]|uniref:Uncharacterized protein n=1 Tax=Panicum virgatum TaxID=38727 RepID=A0A8T0PXC4_PANVG|nr:hypothetical protein PVAP13_7NG183017 [Panicum virgatum]